MNCDVIVYDASGPAGAFGKRLNASKPTGGTEVHAVQLCEGFASLGLNVIGQSERKGVECEDSNRGPLYAPHDYPMPPGPIRCGGLITIGSTHAPDWIYPDRHVALFTHDPPHNIPHIGHLRWSRIVCVSKWQASRFPLGWDTVVIPAIIDDWIYDLPPVPKNPKKFVSISAWWKGGQDTLVLWEKLRPKGCELHFGSPYSHPANLREIVERVPGCVYVDLANPGAVVESMRDAAGVFRCSSAPETFGASDAIAQILGCRIHVFAPNGPGALLETLGDEPGVSSDYEAWRGEFLKMAGSPPQARYFSIHDAQWRLRDYRARVIIPQWVQLLGLEERRAA